MNPKNVASARTARLAREVSTPVYSTSTPAPKREHVTMIEMADSVHRMWTGPYMGASEQRAGIEYWGLIGYSISDIDCSVKCWCTK